MKNAHFSDIKPIQIEADGVKGVNARVLISKQDGAPTCSMRMFELAEGGCTFRHIHNYEHVVFIIEGNGELFFEGNTSELKAGNAVFVPPNKLHQFINTGNEKMRLLCIIPNGDDIRTTLK